MRDALDDQIEYFEAHLAAIRKRHGAVWAVVARQKLVRTFPDFPAAATFVQSNYRGESVLIRHTQEPELTAPFVDIAS